MKILVDKMPTIPSQCVLASHLHSNSGRICSLGKGAPACVDTKYCSYLKVDFLKKEFHIPKQDIVLHPFTATTYSEAAMRTADKTLSKEKALMEGLVGINSEAGEALDIWKKYEFHKHDLDKEAIAYELGDVLWYLNEAALALGYSLEQIMLANIKKLEERYPNGFDPERSKNREG